MALDLHIGRRSAATRRILPLRSTSPQTPFLSTTASKCRQHSGEKLLIRPRSGAEGHAKKVFDCAKERAFGVSIEAIAKLNHGICRFVFAPDDPEDAASNFVAPPLTMKVRQDLKPAQEANRLLWWATRRSGITCTRSASRRVTSDRALEYIVYNPRRLNFGIADDTHEAGVSTPTASLMGRTAIGRNLSGLHDRELSRTGFERVNYNHLIKGVTLKGTWAEEASQDLEEER
jgi:hypothetical protein